tara:strand:- start:12370 stop:13041 length:672 start_codon:yes stop_codon:yes gene_type:complete
MSKDNHKPKGLINIKGKEYLQVNGRLIQFHELYPNGSINTEIVSDTQDSVVMITKVIPDVKHPERCFTGIAQENRGSTFINKTSHYENCETSSRGRALAGLGLGIEESLASSEEVANAMIQQDEQRVLAGIKEQILKLMNIFDSCQKWIPHAINLGVAKADILNVSLNYVLNSKSVAEAEERVTKTNLRFTDIFDKFNKKVEKEKAAAEKNKDIKNVSSNKGG